MGKGQREKGAGLFVLLGVFSEMKALGRLRQRQEKPVRKSPETQEGAG